MIPEPPPTGVTEPVFPGDPRKWDYPEGASLVAETEKVVQTLAQKMLRDVKLTTALTLGPEGRPYGHVKLNREEQLEQHKMLLEQADPEQWAQQLQAGDPKRVIREWIKRNAAARGETQEPTNG